MTETNRAVTLEDILAELRSLKGHRSKRQRPRLEPLLLPLMHAAELLGVSRPTLREMVATGRLTMVKLPNGDPRIPRHCIDEYVARLEAEAAPKVRKAPAPRKALTGAEIQAEIMAIKIT